MSEQVKTPAKETQNKPPMPEYFRFDERKRQEFLSQVGTFTDEQRGLFNKLCDLWEPVCSFSKAAVKLGISTDNNSFRSLMHRMKGAHCGLLQHIYRDNQLQLHQVILTDREDKSFYYHLIENEMQRCFLSEITEFPNLKDLDEAGFTIPRTMIDNKEKDVLCTVYAGKEGENLQLIRLEGFSRKDLVVTPRSIKTMVDIARFKIRTTLNHSGVLSTLTRVMKIKISDLEKELRTNDPVHWHKIGSAILDHKDDFLLKHKNMYQGIFIAAEIVLAFSVNEIAASEQQRREEEVKRERMKRVCLRIGQKEDFLVSQKELNDFLEPEVKRWSDFKDLFYDTYVKHKARTGLPAVVFTGKSYIHREHLYPLFKQELDTASLELTEYYSDMMTRLLRTRGQGKNPVFANRDSFKADIRSRISEIYPFLDSMLNKPRIVSEGILHYGKSKLKIKSIDRIKEILVRYFYEGVIKFKDIDFLLHLYLKDLFEDTFRELPFFKRLVLKLTGRYESFQDAFNGLSRAAAVKPDAASTASTGRESYTSRTVGREDVHRCQSRSQVSAPSSRKRGRGSTGKAASSKRKPAPAPSPQYSKKQIDRAWSDFDEAFTKNNK